MKTVSIDESNFSEIRKRDVVYVDKTRQMYNIFNGGKYFFISRPRRFGKSILCSTLAALFAGKKELFKDLWIEKSDWEWAEYPIIHLDMTLAAAADYSMEQVRSQTMLLLQGIAKKYGIDTFASDFPAGAFGELIGTLYHKTGKPVVVIIDEYDKPVLDAINDPVARIERHKFLAALYAPLKASSEYLRLVFLTGVFKFTKTSIFSGLNNIKDLTFSPEAGDLLGYTEQELRGAFSEHLEVLAKKLKITIDEAIVVLREKYNGYRFGAEVDTGELSTSVYNPYGLNCVFNANQLVDRWFLSGTPTFLIKKLQERSFAGIDAAALRTDFDILEQSCSPEQMTDLALLYYAGYVTMKEFDARSRMVSLDFPNTEVARAMSLHLLPLISEKQDVTALRDITIKIADAFFYQDLADLKDLFNQAFAQLPHYYLFGTQESYFQTVMYFLLNMARLIVTAEDLMHRGRMDLSVQTPSAVYILELKMDQSPSKAIEQIKQRNYAEKYRHLGRQIYLVGIELSAQDKVVRDILVEKAT